MPDGEQADEPLRRPRGRARHPVQKRSVVAPAALVARLFERRLHVLVASIVSVATVALISGAVTLTSLTGAARPDGAAATVVETQRPTPTDPGAPSSFAPILPSAGPPTSASPTSPAPSPVDGPATPVTEAPVEPPVEPVGTEPPPPPPAATPGPTSEPDAPSGPGEPQECDGGGGFLGIPLFGPPCP